MPWQKYRIRQVPCVEEGAASVFDKTIARMCLCSSDYFHLYPDGDLEP